MLAAVSGTEKWATKPLEVPSKWPVRAGCCWAEQSLRCPAWPSDSPLVILVEVPQISSRSDVIYNDGSSLSPPLCSQMFVVAEAEAGTCRLHEFTISGTTYTPEGEV